MLRRVRAPWSPTLGARQKALRSRRASVYEPSTAKHAGVGHGKRVRLTQRTHRDVLRRSFVNAADRAESRDRLVNRSCRTKQVRIRRGVLR